MDTSEKDSASNEVTRVLAQVSHVPFVSQPEQFLVALRQGWRGLGVITESA